MDAIFKDKDFKYLFFEDRLKTFRNWKYDKVKEAKCTSEALARAGFVKSSLSTTAKCLFCGKDLDWDPEDDPAIEHANHSTMCPFIEVGVTDDAELTVGQFKFLLAAIAATKTMDRMAMWTEQGSENFAVAKSRLAPYKKHIADSKLPESKAET